MRRQYESTKTFLKHQIWRNFLILFLLFSLLVAVFLISMNTGYSRLSASDTLRTLFGGGDARENLILFEFRLPRIVIAMMAGAGLAVSGCIIQGTTGNVLAEPGLLGINAGAGLTVILYTLFFTTGELLSVLVLPFLALIGAGGAALVIYMLSYSRREISSTRLILTGLAVQAGLTSLTTVLVVRLDERQYQFVQTWQVGSIWGSNWNFVLALLPWLLILLPYIMRKAGVLDTILLGDETASGLGVDVRREKRKLLFTAVAFAASSVAVSGSIGFVGLLAPHLSRKLVGSKHAFLLPTCALSGALLVTAADIVARTIMQPEEIPAGIVVAVIGAPYFLFLMITEREN